MNCCGTGSDEPKQNNTSEQNVSSSNKIWMWILGLAIVGVAVYLLTK